MNRRDFLGALGVSVAAIHVPRLLRAASPTTEKPSVILCMTDDQGWGDTGYNGHPVLRTPNLDAMVQAGLRFNRFYSGAPVCSPTRGSCITGRHPYRYGIFSANVGHMRPEEITLAEALKTQGYVTGHFGKWHLGTLTNDVRDGRRGGKGDKDFSPPWMNGFDECFSTEQAVPTWDPMKNQPIPTQYWMGPGKSATENLEGDDSRVLMDRAIPFIRSAVQAKKPFLAVVWFHTPHEPVRGGPEFLKMYPNYSKDEQHYYAAITAMDLQMARLRKELRDLGIADNTMLWFCSDNGPEHKTGPGSAGPLRGRKRDLFEGGVRVPGILEWPARVKPGRTTDLPCSTSDYFPTVLDVLGFKMQGQPEPIDGVSLMPLIDGRMTERPVPIAFESGNQVSLTDNRYKIISTDGGKTYMLFDLVENPGETKDLAAEKPEIVAGMRATLEAWRASCRDSQAGKDYR
jgi:arylsulfatase A-like enzyme